MLFFIKLNSILYFCCIFRSREKRRISDLVLETRVLELTRENSVLKAELYAIKEKFGMSQSQVSVRNIIDFLFSVLLHESHKNNSVLTVAR